MSWTQDQTKPKFKVEVDFTFKGQFEVEATSAEQAEAIVKTTCSMLSRVSGEGSTARTTDNRVFGWWFPEKGDMNVTKCEPN